MSSNTPQTMAKVGPVLSDPLTALLRVIEVQCRSLKILSLTAGEADDDAPGGPAFYWLLSDSVPLAVETADGSAIAAAGDLVIATSPGSHNLAIPLNHTGSGNGKATARLLAGKLAFGRNDVDSLIGLLPPFIQVSATTQNGPLNNLLMLLMHEANVRQAGHGASADALTQALLVLALRHDCVSDGLADESMFHSSVEIGILGTMLMMRNHLDSPWTVDSLADSAGMSRSRYALRFAEVIQQTPMRYLFESRMSRARDLLRQDHYGLKEIARRVGYRSTSAFSTAFKKWSGLSPQDFRKGRHTVGDR